MIAFYFDSHTKSIWIMDVIYSFLLPKCVEHIVTIWMRMLKGDVEPQALESV